MSRKRKIVLGIAGLFAISVLLLREPIQRCVLEALILRAEAPSQAAFVSLLAEAANPLETVKKLWDSGKVPHRFSAMIYLKDHLEVFTRAEPLVLEAAHDRDMSVRELALGILASRKHPALVDSALAQLNDADPQIRLLGIQYLKQQPPQSTIPVLISLMDDSEPQVIATASVLLRQTTGHKVDLKVADALAHNLEESRDKISEAVRSWKDWWRNHQHQYRPRETLMPQPSVATSLVSDFTLPRLDGTQTSLSQFRGKAVLLNFWATWCPSCRQEIPDLIALQNCFSKELVVLGISLDGVNDEHGHAPGEHDHDGDENQNHEQDTLQRVKGEVRAVVQKENINYPVLLDTKNTVGSRFNGGELPTNILLDQEGRVCRRFIGARSLTVLARMVNELLEPRIAQQQVK